MELRISSGSLFVLSLAAATSFAQEAAVDPTPAPTGAYMPSCSGSHLLKHHRVVDVEHSPVLCGDDRIPVERELVVLLLLTGERGTGKALVARAIYQNSSRANQPLRSIAVVDVSVTMSEETLTCASET